MKYTYDELAKMIDHSLLHPTMTDLDLEEGCRLAARYGVASVCIKPYAVKLAAKLLADRADIRGMTRQRMMQHGVLVVEATELITLRVVEPVEVRPLMVWLKLARLNVFVVVPSCPMVKLAVVLRASVIPSWSVPPWLIAVSPIPPTPFAPLRMSVPPE